MHDSGLECPPQSSHGAAKTRVVSCFPSWSDKGQFYHRRMFMAWYGLWSMLGGHIFLSAQNNQDLADLFQENVMLFVIQKCDNYASGPSGRFNIHGFVNILCGKISVWVIGSGCQVWLLAHCVLHYRAQMMRTVAHATVFGFNSPESSIYRPP